MEKGEVNHSFEVDTNDFVVHEDREKEEESLSKQDSDQFRPISNGENILPRKSDEDEWSTIAFNSSEALSKCNEINQVIDIEKSEETIADKEDGKIKDDATEEVERGGWSNPLDFLFSAM